MIRDKKVVRNYASALLSTIETNEEIGEWEAALETIAGVEGLCCKKISEKMTLEQFEQQVIGAVIDCFAMTIRQRLHNFLMCLFWNRHLAHLPKIFEMFIKLGAQRQGVEEVWLVIARRWSAVEKKEAQAHFEKIFSNVRLRWKIDPELLTGIKICYRNWVIDLSGRKKLEQMQHQFSTP